MIIPSVLRRCLEILMTRIAQLSRSPRALRVTLGVIVVGLTKQVGRYSALDRILSRYPLVLGFGVLLKLLSKQLSSLVDVVPMIRRGLLAGASTSREVFIGWQCHFKRDGHENLS